MGRTTVYLPSLMITIALSSATAVSQQATPVESPPDKQVTGRSGNEQAEKRAPPACPADATHRVFVGYRHEVKEAKPAWFHQFDKEHGYPGSGLTLSFFHVKFSSHLEGGRAVLYLTDVRVSSGLIVRHKKNTDRYQSLFVHEATHGAQHLRGLTLLAKNFENDATKMGLLYEPISGRIKIYDKRKTHDEDEKLAERLGNWLHELYIYYKTQGNTDWFTKAKKDAKITATSSWDTAREDAVKSPASESEAYYSQYQFDPETMGNVFQRDFAPLAKTGTAADQAVNGFPGQTNMTDERNNWPGRWEIEFCDGPPSDQ